MLTPAVLGIVYLIAVAWPLARIDWREHRLPNRLVLPAFPITLAGQLASLLLGDRPLRLLQSFSLSLLVFALGLLLNRYAGLGMGDVKLLAAMALSLGWFQGELVFYAILIACVIASLTILLAWLAKLQTFRAAIALGPFLFAGYLLVVTTLL